MTVEKRLNRKQILQTCSHVLPESELQQIEDNYERVYKRIIIFELRSWRIGHTVRYELEREQADVRLARQQEVQKLDIELSLRSYISHLYLTPYSGRSIYLEGQIVRPVNYDETVKRLAQQKGLKAPELDSKLQQKCSKFRLALRWAGVVEIPHQVQLNIVKTEIESMVERCLLEGELKKIFSEDRELSELKR
ncbi:unnamed protein product [Sphagnum balticum]